MAKRPILGCWLIIWIVASAGAVVAGEGVVALQTADPSCLTGTSYRYVDCGNGTVTDNETGLVWLAKADCFGQLKWQEAMAAVAGLADLPDGACGPDVTAVECDCDLDDGSSPGEWRLPSLQEWWSMIESADLMECSPAITTDSGTDCYSDYCPCTGPSTAHAPACPCSFYGVHSESYWSSSTRAITPDMAWRIHLGAATHGGSDKDTFSYYVWPVRDGQ